MTENWKTSTRSLSGETCVEADGPWRTASYSSLSGDCVEVNPGVVVRVRDTKDRERGIIRIGAHPWLAFLSGGWEI